MNVTILQRSDNEPVSLLRAALWLALIFVIAKAVSDGIPKSWNWPLLLAMSSYQDVLFALALGLIGDAADRAVRRRSRKIGRFVRGGFLTLFTVCAFYSVIAVGVFHYFTRQLSFDLLRMVRGTVAIRSSVLERLTPSLAVALVGVPIVFVLLARSRPRWQGNRRCVFAFLIAFALVWVALGRWEYAQRPNDWRHIHLAANPHLELIRTTYAGLTGRRRPVFPTDFPPGDMAEFRSFAARGDGAYGGYSLAKNMTRPRNVVVVTLESVGAKYLSLYGNAYDTTPNLVAESANAVVCDHAYAQAPYTYCSFMAVNFSIYPGLPWCFAPWAGRPCPPALVSILHGSGWRAAYFHNGDLDWAGSRWLLERQRYDSIFDYRDMGCAPLTSWGTEDRCMIDRLIRWIDEKPGAPFVAYCWTDQTHDPYAASPGEARVDFFKGKNQPPLATELSPYLNNIRNVDAQLGRLFNALRERGLADDTLVVVTGDHGEAFRDPHDQRGHSLTIFEEDIHVPMVFWNPRLFTPGSRIAAIGSHVDMNPTICDILGIEPPRDWQGRSMFDPGRPPRAFFMTNIVDYLFGIREGNWKYIVDGMSGREMLFDLDADPTEQRNKADRERARCDRFRQRIGAWVTFEEEFLHGRMD